MSNALQPWEFLLITLSGWVNRHQQNVIDYLIEENRVLKGMLGKKGIRLTDDKRRRPGLRLRLVICHGHDEKSDGLSKFDS